MPPKNAGGILKGSIPVPGKAAADVTPAGVAHATSRTGRRRERRPGPEDAPSGRPLLEDLAGQLNILRAKHKQTLFFRRRHRAVDIVDIDAGFPEFGGDFRQGPRFVVQFQRDDRLRESRSSAALILPLAGKRRIRAYSAESLRMEL
jgi:hypothetical protein